VARKRQPSENLERFRIEQMHRTVRFAIVTIAIVAGLKVTFDGLTALLDRPAWLQALMYVLAFIAGGSPPAFALWRALRFVRKWTRENLSRSSTLEKLVDPARSSSGLTPEGQDPPSDLPAVESKESAS
jgi:hypothetical protein